MTEEWKSQKGKSKLRFNLLFIQEGKCFICQIEEWRSRKRLHMHRIIKGRDGGLYTLENTILCCFRCHHRAEGLSLSDLNLIRAQNAFNSLETVAAS